MLQIHEVNEKWNLWTHELKLGKIYQIMYAKSFSLFVMCIKLNLNNIIWSEQTTELEIEGSLPLGILPTIIWRRRRWSRKGEHARGGKGEEKECMRDQTIEKGKQSMRVHAQAENEAHNSTGNEEECNNVSLYRDDREEDDCNNNCGLECVIVFCLNK